MTANVNILWARLLLDGLLDGCREIRHACVSPGSRSAPLAVALHEHPDLEVTVHLDERSAAFFALGIGKATGSPAILVCTSGTAAANYLPAIIEASLARVPMIVLTADRPPESRQAGESQTCDQVHLYGRYPRFFQDLPVPEPTLDLLRQAPAIAAHGAASACSPVPGVAHLNVPFREPLAPTPHEPERIAELESTLRGSLRENPGRPRIVLRGPTSPSSLGRSIDARIREARRGLVLIGPTAGRSIEVEHLQAFARDVPFPVCTDITSELRFVEDPQIDRVEHADLLFRAETIARVPPDLVIRIGGMPTSKAVRQYLLRHRPPTLLVQQDADRIDPDATASWTLEASGAELASMAGEWTQSAHEAERGAWSEHLRAAGRLARETIDRGSAPLEAQAISAAVATLPEGGSVFFANSLPIRWADAYLGASPIRLRPFASRGVNGIDGIPSTAFGIAYATGAPLLLVTGDLAFLHDLGGLRAHRTLGVPLMILLLNNNGGGIFSHLPIANFPELFEPLFGTPHDGDLGAAARVFGLDHLVVEEFDQIRTTCTDGFAKGGVKVIELRTKRAEMAKQHQRVAEQVAQTLERELPRWTV